MCLSFAFIVTVFLCSNGEADTSAEDHGLSKFYNIPGSNGSGRKSDTSAAAAVRSPSRNSNATAKSTTSHNSSMYYDKHFIIIFTFLE